MTPNVNPGPPVVASLSPWPPLSGCVSPAVAGTTPASYAGVASASVGPLPIAVVLNGGSPLSNAVQPVTDSRTSPAFGEPTTADGTCMTIELPLLVPVTLVPPA